MFIKPDVWSSTVHIQVIANLSSEFEFKTGVMCKQLKRFLLCQGQKNKKICLTYIWQKCYAKCILIYLFPPLFFSSSFATLWPI